MKLKKYEKNPIISPNDSNEWEDLCVCNPGAWYEDGTFYLLYRASGNDEDHVIRFGLATSKDGFHFVRSSDKPVLSPSIDGPDAGCIEDPRIIKMDGTYYITYAYRPYPPGRYWLKPGNEAEKPFNEYSYPIFIKENITNSGLLMTKDFIHYKRLGRITQATIDDRDVILFPEKINGKYYMLHRPKEWCGSGYLTKFPSIWLSCSTDLLSWREDQLLITGERWWEQKIGGASPPVKTKKGWVMLYHGVDDKGIYRVGAALLNLNNPYEILGRTREFIMEPEFDYEMKGLYNGCVFPTGCVLVEDTLYVYYGAADKYCAVATCRIDELVSGMIN